MKRRFLSLILAAVLCTGLTVYASAADFTADNDGRYTITIPGKTAGNNYTLVIVAGDYADKEMPEISADNIIYINQVTADENGTVSFSDFIPMTESVGTIYIGGDDTPTTEGLLMTESGFGYNVGRLISYSGTAETVVIPDSITSVDSEAFEEENNVKNVVVENGNTVFSDNALTAGTKLFISPLASAAKDYALKNGLSYAYLGDLSGDGKVDMDDYKQLLGLYSKGENITQSDLTILLDLDFNGKVNFRDLSVLLQFIGGKIGDYYMAFPSDLN